MALTTRSSFWAGVRPGLVNSIVGMTYDDFPVEFTGVFKITKAPPQAYVEKLIRAGLGPAFVKPEGQAFDEDAGGDVGIARFLMSTVGLKFRLTQEAYEDNLYGDLLQQYSKGLAKSIRETEEIISANVLNQGTNASYPLWNGQPLFSTAHPLWGGGTFGNILPTQADISESAIEDALTAIGSYVDDRGNPISVQAVRIVGGIGIQFDATRILKSTQRVGTSDNDINAIKNLGIFGEPVHIMRRLTNPKSWGIVTNVDDGAIFWNRIPLGKPVQKQDDDGNYVVYARRRFAVGVIDPRAFYWGSA